MESTPIKINKSANGQGGEAKNVLNLNNSAAAPRPSRETKKYLWVFIALILIEGAAIIWLSLIKPVSPYFKILPQNLIASSYFNQSSLLALLNNNDRPLLSRGSGALRSLLDKIKIDRPEQLSELFEDQTALAVLPQNADQTPAWLMLATIKAPADAFSQAQDKAEQALKQSYDLTDEPYRQIKVTRVKPLDQSPDSIFYARTKNYFILSNNSAALKETLDKIIGR